MNGNKFCEATPARQGDLGQPACPDREACMSGWTCREVRAADRESLSHPTDPKPSPLTGREKNTRLGRAATEAWNATDPSDHHAAELFPTEEARLEQVGHAIQTELASILDEEALHDESLRQWSERHPSIAKPPVWSSETNTLKPGGFLALVTRNGSLVGSRATRTRWGAERAARKIRREWEKENDACRTR